MERSEIQDIKKVTVVLYVKNTVANSLASSLYPDRQTLWESIHDTDGLKGFIYSAVDKHVSLYKMLDETNPGFVCQSCSTVRQ